MLRASLPWIPALLASRNKELTRSFAKNVEGTRTLILKTAIFQMDSRKSVSANMQYLKDDNMASNKKFIFDGTFKEGITLGMTHIENCERTENRKKFRFSALENTGTRDVSLQILKCQWHRRDASSRGSAKHRTVGAGLYEHRCDRINRWSLSVKVRESEDAQRTSAHPDNECTVCRVPPCQINQIKPHRDQTLANASSRLRKQDRANRRSTHWPCCYCHHFGALQWIFGHWETETKYVCIRSHWPTRQPSPKGVPSTPRAQKYYNF